MNNDYDIKVSVCLCTYKRPVKLGKCLESLLHQTCAHTFEVIVTDNDCERSGEHVVEQFKAAFQSAGIPLIYLVEPGQNIALARNRCLQPARGELVAFIDDDERASSCWLQNLYAALIETNADGVWGPVIPDIPESFPNWMCRSRLFYRKDMKDGVIIPIGMLYTSNALVKRELLTMRTGPFDKELGRTGGEDGDLFNWLKRQGFKFVWASNAEVLEELEDKRRHIRWHLIRTCRGGWGYSRRLVKTYGIVIGFLRATLTIVPRIFRSIMWAIFNINNIRYAGLIVLMKVSMCVGILCYFIGIRIEEYNDEGKI